MLHWMINTTSLVKKRCIYFNMISFLYRFSYVRVLLSFAKKYILIIVQKHTLFFPVFTYYSNQYILLATKDICTNVTNEVYTAPSKKSMDLSSSSMVNGMRTSPLVQVCTKICIVTNMYARLCSYFYIFEKIYMLPK